VQTWRRVAVGATAAAMAVVGIGATRTDAGSGREDAVIVRGDVDHRLRLTKADLDALPQVTITVTFQSGSTPQTHTYTGPLLLDVLNAAGPDFDPAVKNDSLSHVVTAVGSDGYEATVAWGEFDPLFEGKKILVATVEDGTPLLDAGPRLVVPGDVRGGRYVSDVEILRLIDA
jgi:DMSO/TMAO reductase YedYZ molybdopterin-dependent catalytic subunit